MAETSVNKLPYPTTNDASDGSGGIKSLAELLDTLKWGSRNLKPTKGVVGLTAEKALGAGANDLAGLSIALKPAVNSKVILIASLSISHSADSSMQFWFNDGDDGDIEGGYKPWQAVTGSGEELEVVTLMREYELAANVEQTYKVRANRYAGSGGSVTYGQLLYEVIAA